MKDEKRKTHTQTQTHTFEVILEKAIFFLHIIELSFLKDKLEFSLQITKCKDELPNLAEQKSNANYLAGESRIYATLKITSITTKIGTQKQITFCLLKNYTAEAYKETPGKVNIPNLWNFDNFM